MEKLLSAIQIFLLVSMGHHINAQVSIQIIDEDSKKALPQMKLTINRAKTYVSDRNGMVRIEQIQDGDSLEVSSVFHKPIVMTYHHDLSVIALSKQTKSIKGISIKGNKSPVKIEAGKTTFETSQATIQNGNLKDLLLQIPGVYVDNNNQISVRGKDGFRILIDGKTSQLALTDMNAFLQSIPAGSIKTIEVITNPGAQFDAQGKSGIIQIKLKKDKREGFNSKINLGIGSLLNKYNTGIFGNYKNDRINIFGNYSFNYNDQWFGYSEDRKSSFQGKTRYYDYIASWRDIGRSHNLRGGIDFFLPENLNLGYTSDINMSIGTGSNHKLNPAWAYDENRALMAYYEATNKSRNNVSTISNSISLKKTYDSSQIEWNIDLSHTSFSEFNTNTNENFAYSGMSIPLENEYYYFEPELNNKVQNIMFRADMVIPSKFAKLELGVKNETNFNRNAYFAFLKDYHTAKYTDPKYMNDFNYNDNIFAGYFQTSKSIRNIALNLGLRAENTIIASNNDAVSRQYLNWFPNLGFSTPIDSQITLTAKYSRRIERPRFNQLNNRIIYYNRSTANVGVPTLQPEIANLYSVNLDRSFLKGKLNLSLGSELNFIQNDITELNYIDPDFTSFFTYGNAGEATLFNTFLNIYLRPNDLFDINLTPTYQYSKYAFTSNQNIYNESSGSGFMLSGQTNIHLPGNTKLSFNGFLNTNMIWAQGHSDFLGTLNASVSRNFLNNKLSVELSCQDLFDSNIWLGYQTTGNIQSRGIWKPETRIAWLNLSYSFGVKNNYQRKELEKSERIRATGR